jgi:predicted alpha/beta-hydrolase family hydrolase
MAGHIILSHGSDSSPDATKVSVLAALAGSLGWTCQRPDYRQDDIHGHAGSVLPRLARLRAAIDASPTPPVLVGSSMGAFVSSLASLDRPVAGLFLMALPVEIPGFDTGLGLARDVPSFLVHGYDDDVCPADRALGFAAGMGMPTLLLADDHRLSAHVEAIAGQFLLFLEQFGE